jgi:hypothetical protein
VQVLGYKDPVEVIDFRYDNAIRILRVLELVILLKRNDTSGNSRKDVEPAVSARREWCKSAFRQDGGISVEATTRHHAAGRGQPAWAVRERKLTA